MKTLTQWQKGFLEDLKEVAAQPGWRVIAGRHIRRQSDDGRFPECPLTALCNHRHHMRLRSYQTTEAGHLLGLHDLRVTIIVKTADNNHSSDQYHPEFRRAILDVLNL